LTKGTLKQFKTLLTAMEQSEIYGYKDIYFAGSLSIYKIGSSKRRTGADLAELYNIQGTCKDKDGSLNNNGYDDSRGDLYLTKHDHIAYRYEIISLLGKGSFGQVCKCYDHKMKCLVALKIIRNKSRFEKQGLVEVKVLNRLRAEDAGDEFNIVRMYNNFFFRGHLCFTFELLGMNLYEWIKAGQFRGVHLGVTRLFAEQMLQCLLELKHLGIVHCDLKPENILLKDSSNSQPSRYDSNAQSLALSSTRSIHKIPVEFDAESPKYKLKVIDFGSSCYENEKLYTYVQSRFYRSPEVILGASYTADIDIWSLGCILAELLLGFPLFPGENENDQLACIMELRGIPPTSIILSGSRSNLFFGNLIINQDSENRPKILANSKGKKRKPGSRNLSSTLKCSDMAFLDFIDSCLNWDPQFRLKPSEALQHPFITGLRFIPKSMHTLTPSYYESKIKQVNVKSSEYYKLEIPRKNNHLPSVQRTNNSIVNNSQQSSTLSMTYLNDSLPPILYNSMSTAKKLTTYLGIKRPPVRTQVPTGTKWLSGPKYDDIEGTGIRIPGVNFDDLF
jgi:serine/threonine protein kinase